ncbi:hypothetical protein MMC21_007910 [Puttea exsequens]|nr:hypothetical protein [Puttea exsequens]
MASDTKGAKITLYWLEKSRSQRVLWLLEELKVKYELKTFKRTDMLAPPELKEIHPLGKSPVVSIEIESNKAKPLVLAESASIIEYLIDHFGPHLAPKRYQAGKDGELGGEMDDWIRYRYFMHYAEGSLMPLLVISLLFNAIKSQTPFFIKPVVLMITGGVESKFLSPNLKMHWQFLESQLATSPDNGGYLCGAHLTGADILMSFPLGAVRGQSGLTKEAFPKLWDYVDRLQNEEGYKKAAQKIIEIEGSYDPKL